VVEKAEPRAADAERGRERLDGGLVLVVDDDPDVVRVVRSSLEEEGLRVIAAATAAGAARVASDRRPDVVLVRAAPGGREALEGLLGRDPGTASIPLVTLALRAGPEAPRVGTAAARRGDGAVDVGALLAEVRRQLAVAGREGGRRAAL
jgi:two-component system KDP operon response regulator KdpE